MIIQHNIPALNSYNKLANNNTNLAKNLEKLSSGYRINRAGDDAAGLAISEKMRAQIKGLETATKNAQDGVSLIQTAEGALEEVHSILNRLVELAGQSANGIYDDATDRQYIQEEVNELRAEINRISETDFNGIALLDGSLGGAKENFATNTVGLTGVTVSGMSSDMADKLGAITATYLAGGQATMTLANASKNFGGMFSTNAISWDMVNRGGNDSGGSVTFRIKIDRTGFDEAENLLADKLEGATINVEHGALVAAGGNAATTGSTNGQNLMLQIGDKANQRLAVEIQDMSSTGLGLDAISLVTQDLANAAIDTIRDAIDAVNLQRDKLGAKQNRLEHTINNLTTTTENITDAESRIRDTDMAKEMMLYTKNSILVQSSQAMLAQANQLPSSVLNLLY